MNLTSDKYPQIMNLTSVNITSVFSNIIKEISEIYCPFNDLKGLNYFCNNITSRSNYRATEKQKLPLLLGVGWDPIDGVIKLPIFDLTYDENKYYIANNGKNYSIPDQLDLIKKDLNNKTIYKKTFNTLNDFLQKYDPNRNIITAGPFALPINTLKNFVHFFDTGNSNMNTIIEFRNNYDLAINSKKIKLNNYFKNIIRQLPEEYDEQVYEMFLYYFGSQIVIQGSAGALAFQSIIVKNCYGNMDLLNQCELYMLKTFYENYYSHVDFKIEFSQRSKADIIDMSGGDPKIIDPKNWKERVQTIDDFPVFIKVKTVNITDYIGNTKIKVNVERAIKNYYDKGQSKIENILSDYNNQINTPKSITFLNLMDIDPLITNNIFYNKQLNLNLKENKSITEETGNPYNMFICGLSSDNKVQSSTNNDLINKCNEKTKDLYANYQKFVIKKEYGDIIKFGCSESSYHWHIKYKNDDIYKFTSKGLCCINCIIDTFCNDKGCFYRGCNCPTF